MKKRDKIIVSECLQHFLIDGWDIRISADSYQDFGPFKQSDLTKQGRARLARLMPYLSLRKEGEDVWLVKNFKKELETFKI